MAAFGVLTRTARWVTPPCIDAPRGLQLHGPILGFGEQRRASAQQDRDDVELELVDDARPEVLPEDHRAALDADVPARRGPPRNVQGSLWSAGDECVARAAALDDRLRGTMRDDEDRRVEARLVTPRLDADVQHRSAHDNGTDGGEMGRQERTCLLVGLAHEHPVMEAIAVIAHAVADLHVRSGDEPVERHGHGGDDPSHQELLSWNKDASDGTGGEAPSVPRGPWDD